MGRGRWWAGKVRQFVAHLVARVAPAERAGLETWLNGPQLALYDSMVVADRRHGLDVVAQLRRAGVTDPEVLLAGLLHDAGKGRTGVWPRVAHGLGQGVGDWVPRLLARLPGMPAALDRLANHAEASAALAEAAGCTNRTIELIRWQDEPRDPEFGALLKLADEAS